MLCDAGCPETPDHVAIRSPIPTIPPFPSPGTGALLAGLHDWELVQVVACWLPKYGIAARGTDEGESQLRLQPAICCTQNKDLAIPPSPSVARCHPVPCSPPCHVSSSYATCRVRAGWCRHRPMVMAPGLSKCRRQPPGQSPRTAQPCRPKCYEMSVCARREMEGLLILRVGGLPCPATLPR